MVFDLFVCAKRWCFGGNGMKRKVKGLEIQLNSDLEIYMLLQTQIQISSEELFCRVLRDIVVPLSYEPYPSSSPFIIQ